MSDKNKTPEQLSLPFASEDIVTHSAQVFLFRAHKARPDSALIHDGAAIPKDKEREILDRVLERAERLSWYK